MRQTDEYDMFEQRLTTVHRCLCIDGTITGRCNCVGYCSFEDHPGFLTADIRNNRKCIIKKCRYYVSKGKKIKEKKNEAVLCAALDCTSLMPWIRIMSVRTVEKIKTIFYVTVTNDYSITTLENRISEIVGEKIQMRKIDCDYERAVNLVCEKNKR